LTPDGYVSKTWTPSAGLTEEVGTYTYYLKLLSGGIVVGEEPLTLVVAEGSISMSVTWQDQNNDRVVDQNELVTFTAYINWAFVETPSQLGAAARQSQTATASPPQAPGTWCSR